MSNTLHDVVLTMFRYARTYGARMDVCADERTDAKDEQDKNNMPPATLRWAEA